MLCGQYINASTLVYLDSSVFNYTEVNNMIKRFDSDQFFTETGSCRWTALYMICLSIYPQCNNETKVLVPPCEDNCLYHTTRCAYIGRALQIPAISNDLILLFILNCSNPFRAFNSYGSSNYNANNSDNCYNFGCKLKYACICIRVYTCVRDFVSLSTDST